ncbi:MAG TPA: DUF5916 domain-containing protein [Chitinophagaceae bacterium]
MRNCFLLFLFIGFAAIASAQKKLPAVRTNAKITIDGAITEAAWKDAALATDFVEWRPSAGTPEAEKTKTEVWFLYDDEAIYISGFCHEEKDSISKELVGRDMVGVNDFVGVIFDTYLDKLNGFGYYVTPLGEQYDAKYSSFGEDGSWNGVWHSNSKIVDGGWTFEMKIPYSAIRFSSRNIQDWGLNITRRRNKTGQQFMWNSIDPKITGFLNQFGQWQHLENIKPPLRLSFSPYLASYLDHYPYNEPGKRNWNASVTGGMDLKYGISNSFTLDMTLIPDFGQVQSDNQVLNLSPFEVRYNENRSFFTEGMELFNKGNLFYSRRIGGTPMHHWSVGDKLLPGETIVENPSTVKLINATKVSGRTARGLGIGFFNAVTEPTYATVENGVKEQRSIETNPLTNYNILVLDQSLKNNSSVSLINANTLRNGNDYDANVTSVMWDFYDKKVMWNFNGQVAMSQLIGYLPGKGNLNGYFHRLGFGKPSGRFNFNIAQEIADHKYQQNDLGYFTNNNYLDHYLWVGYKWLKPRGWYNNIYLNFNGFYSRRFNRPNDYQDLGYGINVNGTLKNRWNFGVNTDLKAEGQNYYEARIDGMKFKRPGSWMAGFWIGTDRAKKYSVNAEVYNRISPKYNSVSTDYFFNQKYRFSDRLSIEQGISLQPRKNDIGFAYRNGDSSMFGLRDIRTIVNTVFTKFNFNNRMGLTLRVRHYWTKVENKKFYLLQQDGHLQGTSVNDPAYNFNVNFFNIDMVYTWQFAPGSFLNVVWKDACVSSDKDVRTSYFKNLRQTLDGPQANSFSLKLIYYLDYLDLKKKNRP